MGTNISSSPTDQLKQAQAILKQEQTFIDAGVKGKLANKKGAEVSFIDRQMQGQTGAQSLLEKSQDKKYSAPQRAEYAKQYAAAVQTFIESHGEMATQKADIAQLQKQLGIAVTPSSSTPSTASTPTTKPSSGSSPNTATTGTSSGSSTNTAGYSRPPGAQNLSALQKNLTDAKSAVAGAKAHIAQGFSDLKSGKSTTQAATDVSKWFANYQTKGPDIKAAYTKYQASSPASKQANFLALVKKLEPIYAKDSDWVKGLQSAANTAQAAYDKANSGNTAAPKSPTITTATMPKKPTPSASPKPTTVTPKPASSTPTKPATHSAASSALTTELNRRKAYIATGFADILKGGVSSTQAAKDVSAAFGSQTYLNNAGVNSAYMAYQKNPSSKAALSSLVKAIQPIYNAGSSWVQEAQSKVDAANGAATPKAPTTMTPAMPTPKKPSTPAAPAKPSVSATPATPTPSTSTSPATPKTPATSGTPSSASVAELDRRKAYIATGFADILKGGVSSTQAAKDVSAAFSSQTYLDNPSVNSAYMAYQKDPTNKTALSSLVQAIQPVYNAGSSWIQDAQSKVDASKS
jgi:hypothetical protein